MQLGPNGAMDAITSWAYVSMTSLTISVEFIHFD